MPSLTSEHPAPKDRFQVAIIGCGLIGQSWAIVFARSGADVMMYDPNRDAAVEALSQVELGLERLAHADVPSVVETPGHVAVAKSIEQAIEKADYIQESGPERLEVKAKLTRDIDQIARPGIAIGSSTSGITATQYSNTVPGRARCLVVHPINPPHLLRAVEVVPSQWTDPQITENVKQILQRAGQAVLVLNKEVDGFVINRLQGALLTEAFRLVGDGVVSPEELDIAMTDGLGLRWSVIGPFASIHLNAPEGIGQYVERFGPMYKEMFVPGSQPKDWSDIVTEGLGDQMLADTPLEDFPKAIADRDNALLAAKRLRTEPRTGRV